MTQCFCVDALQAVLRQGIALLPDHRTPSPNTRSTIQDAVLSAFGGFCTPSPSFLAYQRRLQHAKGHTNAQTLCGVAQLPCDHQIRTRLDPLAPSALAPVFVAIFHGLEPSRMVDHLRVLGDQLLVSRDGTTSFASKTLHCPHCLTRPLSHGHTLSSHTAITPVMVCPGRPEVLALPPEYIMPQDGEAKQDCEPRAGTRWLSTHAKAVAPSQVTVLGDDLSSQPPCCALALQQGDNCIVTCKPDSPATLSERLAFWQANASMAELAHRHWNGRGTAVQQYRYINDVLRRGGDDA